MPGLNLRAVLVSAYFKNGMFNFRPTSIPSSQVITWLGCLFGGSCPGHHIDIGGLQICRQVDVHSRHIAQKRHLVRSHGQAGLSDDPEGNGGAKRRLPRCARVTGMGHHFGEGPSSSEGGQLQIETWPPAAGQACLGPRWPPKPVLPPRPHKVRIASSTNLVRPVPSSTFSWHLCAAHPASPFSFTYILHRAASSRR